MSSGLVFKCVLFYACIAAFAPQEAMAQSRECAVILDASSGAAILRRGTCDRRLSPASTFKTVLSLIGFDAGILKDVHEPKLPYKPDVKAPARDRKAVDPETWLRDSVLWYSREITRKLGTERFAAYLQKLGYGNADISGDAGKNNGLTQAWIDSSLEISPNEQAAFMLRLVRCSLPVSHDACMKTKAAMPRFAAKGGWTIHGKTGTVLYRGRADGLRTGWFVGWAERGGKRLVFAHMRDRFGNLPLRAGPQVRDDFLRDLPELVKQ